MKSETINLFYNDIEDFLDENDKNNVFDILSILDFKLNKNSYHFKNMKSILDCDIENSNFDMYDDIINPLYFEFESLLVSLRSSVDILLRLSEHLFEFGLSNNDLNLFAVYKHPRLPKSLKNVFDRFTRQYNNPNWNFIYTSRNEIVHFTSIDTILPISLELYLSDKPVAFFEWENSPREMISFLGNSIRFLDNFCSEFLNAIRVAYKN